MSKRNDLRNVSISHGTLRTEDLTERFLQFLDNESPRRGRKMRKELGEWGYKELSMFLNEDLFQELEQLAPEGYYFGAHPGDGSDFGFWQDDDEQ